MKYNQDIPYIRVGTNYYKIVQRPLISGDQMLTLLGWNRETILQDHHKSIFEKIPRYDGFCIIPDHINYQPTVGNFINRYEELPHKPVEGSYTHWTLLLHHIFGAQYEVGLDYITLLYLRPTQMLPVLCLVSKERNTGKTTFLNALKAIFGANMTYNKNEDFRSQFNSDWANKLIIAVDEVLLDKKEDSERIKNLSTAKMFKSEAKGKDRSEVEFFGKFILCSNNEDSFIQIDPGETRYWIIKVPTLKSDDVFFLSKLIGEIPGFLHYIFSRPLSTQNESRMWFDSKLIRTSALIKVITKNKTKIEAEIIQILNDLLDEIESDKVQLCPGDLIPFLTRSGFRSANRTSIKEIFKEHWKLLPECNSNSYTRYCISIDGHIYPMSGSKGRYYTISKEFLNSKIENDE